MIVTRADLDKVAKAATRACSPTPGSCASRSNASTSRDVADEFTRTFGEAVRAMKLGTSYDFSADMGSLISEGQLRRYPIMSTTQRPRAQRDRRWTAAPGCRLRCSTSRPFLTGVT